VPLGLTRSSTFDLFLIMNRLAVKRRNVTRTIVVNNIAELLIFMLVLLGLSDI
jgi:hypothetical protein